MPGAFGNCGKLTDITFGEGILEIPDGLFARCPGITEITIPETVTKIGEYAFRACENLTTVNVPTKLESIESYAFANCNMLENITFPEKMKEISDSCFSGCSSLKKVDLSKSVELIGGRAFAECGVEILKLPENVSVIEANAFNNCDNLSQVEMNTMLSEIGGNAFSDCDKLKNVKISDSVSVLGTSIFENCAVLTKVQLGKSMTEIPYRMFYQCPKLESIELPYGIVSIGKEAFANCVSFKEITVPRATEEIDASAFSYPDNMTIYGVAGTYAETFANTNKIKFINVDNPASQVTLDTDELMIKVGETKQLMFNVEPENFTDIVSWKSSDVQIVSVDNFGRIKGLKKGTATIKVMVGNQSATCNIEVLQPAQSITLNKTSLSLEALDTYQLTARVNPSSANDQTVSWSSSDDQIVSVDEKGVITAHKKGTAEITAVANDGSGVFRTCLVTVTNNVYMVNSVKELESSHDYENNCSDAWIYSIDQEVEMDVLFDARTEVEQGFDYIYIYDSNETQIGVYTGKELAGQTIRVPGGTVKIKLVSDGGGTAWGFKVTNIKIVTDTPEEPEPSKAMTDFSLNTENLELKIGETWIWKLFHMCL